MISCIKHNLNRKKTGSESVNGRLLYIFGELINCTNTLRVIRLSITLDAIASLLRTFFGEEREDRRVKLFIDT